MENVRSKKRALIEELSRWRRFDDGLPNRFGRLSRNRPFRTGSMEFYRDGFRNSADPNSHTIQGALDEFEALLG
jgi:hypothetical protein